MNVLLYLNLSFFNAKLNKRIEDSISFTITKYTLLIYLLVVSIWAFQNRTQKLALLSKSSMLE